MRNSYVNRLLSFASKAALKAGLLAGEERKPSMIDLAGNSAPVEELKPFLSVADAWAYLRSNKERKGHPGRTTIATGGHGERNRRHLVTVETEYGDYVLHATKGWRRAVGSY